LDTIKTILPILGGTSIFAALFVLLGRAYTTGYYQAMNISSERIALSPAEYSELGSMNLLLFSAIIGVWATALYLLIAVVFATLHLLTRGIRVRYSNVNADRIYSLVSEARKLFARAEYLFRLSTAGFILTFLAGYTLFLLSLFTNMANDFGELIGRRRVVNNMVSINMVSDEPLQINSANVVTSTMENNTYYTYENLRVLLNNDGRYFLFESIDDETCRPDRVFVIQEVRLSSRTITSAPPIAPDCKPTTD
jgi:hypothetical protein